MNVNTISPHTFHIPVLGTGFSVDTPLKVAPYGISSVISLVDDVLIERVRRYHCRQSGEAYEEIPDSAPDSRAQRITAFLNLVDKLVGRKVEALRAAPFTENSEITRYFRLLPDSPLRTRYNEMLVTADPVERSRRQDELRAAVVPGSIDANIMTALDCAVYRDGEKMPPEQNDALAALRGFAQSALRSSIVLSAGINQRLYSYIPQFPDFLPDATGAFKKHVIVKVSDYRSGEIQGRFLAKRGVWVSEFRIESGLNCGGHAFPAQGQLIGAVLLEYREKRAELAKVLRDLCAKAWATMNIGMPASLPDPRVAVQGGIGTAEEHAFLLKTYGADSCGWGTPFMLAPDVINVDAEHLRKLSAATLNEVYLSDCSPLGVPFWNLRTSASEQTRLRRIRDNVPGSVCRKHFLTFNTEFTETPICTASRAYQQRKLAKINAEMPAGPERDAAANAVVQKECICHDLGGCVSRNYGFDKEATPAVCCGPNIAYFSKITDLKHMVDHIYGRQALPLRADRPHMFALELKLNVEHLAAEIEKAGGALNDKLRKRLIEFRDNLLKGIAYYRELAAQAAMADAERFMEGIAAFQARIEDLTRPLENEATAAVPAG